MVKYIMMEIREIRAPRPVKPQIISFLKILSLRVRFSRALAASSCTEKETVLKRKLREEKTGLLDCPRLQDGRCLP